jgi:hypothetical protein
MQPACGGAFRTKTTNTRLGTGETKIFLQANFTLMQYAYGGVFHTITTNTRLGIGLIYSYKQISP